LKPPERRTPPHRKASSLDVFGFAFHCCCSFLFELPVLVALDLACFTILTTVLTKEFIHPSQFISNEREKREKGWCAMPTLFIKIQSVRMKAKKDRKSVCRIHPSPEPFPLSICVCVCVWAPPFRIVSPKVEDRMVHEWYGGTYIHTYTSCTVLPLLASTLIF
jgi:hypothetical protein